MNNVQEGKMAGILLDLLRQDFDPAKLKNFTASDWQVLLDISLQLKLFPPFYLRLIKLQLPNLPPEFSLKIKELFLANLKRNLFLEKELARILSGFKNSNIQVLPLKGTVLARFIYGDVTFRQAPSDLDLLIKPEQFNHAEKVLNELSYSYFGSNVENQSIELKYSNQIKFFRSLEGKEVIFVELHNALRGRFTSSQEFDLWQEAEEKEIEGIKILLPSLEDLLIYLCLLTMSISEFPELRYFYELNSFLNKFGHDIDWVKIGNKIHSTEYKDCLYFALKLTRDFFNLSLPENFLEIIEAGFIKKRIISAYLNKKSILNFIHAEKSNRYYLFLGWYYFISSYLYSRNIFDCIRMANKKIFLPPDDIKILYKDEGKKLILRYFKRVFKPVMCLFSHRA